MIWDFIGLTIEKSIQALKDTDFFYGISIWNFCEIFLALSGMAFIVRAIFKSGKDDGKDD